jgi:hypothetical protein
MRCTRISIVRSLYFKIIIIIIIIIIAVISAQFLLRIVFLFPPS